MAPTPVVIDLLVDAHPDTGPFVHADGRPFTIPEVAQVLDATAEDVAAAIEELAGTTTVVHQAPEVLRALARLIAVTPEAETLGDVQRSAGRPLVELIEDELATPSEIPQSTVATGLEPGTSTVERADDTAVTRTPA